MVGEGGGWPLRIRIIIRCREKNEEGEKKGKHALTVD